MADQYDFLKYDPGGSRDHLQCNKHQTFTPKIFYLIFQILRVIEMFHYFSNYLKLDLKNIFFFQITNTLSILKYSTNSKLT